MKKYFYLLIFLCWPCLAEKTADFDLAVVGFVNFADGIGRQTIGIMDCLKDDLVINYVNTRKNTPINFQDVPNEVQDIIKNRRKGFANVAILEDVLTNGNPDISVREDYYKCMPSAHIKLAYTMFETTTLPDQWSEILNNNFDAAIVPDEFLVDVYKNAGVHIPIFVLPLGIYLESFLQQPLKKIQQDPFIFGFSGTFSERKNHIILFESFVQAFGNNPNVKLRLHGRSNERITEKIQERIHELNLSNVELIINRFSAQEYLEFLKSLDCFVSFSKGEGFSIAPREVLALGIPCILANHTAHKTICNTGLVCPVQPSIMQPAYYPHLDKTVGYELNCTVADGAGAFQEMYENYDYYIKNAQKAREWATQYLYKNLQPYYATMVKPKTIVLGNENRIEKNYLITSCTKLYEKYQTLFPVKPPENVTSSNTFSQFDPEGLDVMSLNPNGLKATDLDIIGAYRVMTGKQITPSEFLHFKQLCSSGNWTLTNLAHHLLAMISTQEHLNVPLLSQVKPIKLLLHNGTTIFGYASDLFIAYSIKQTGYWEPPVEKIIRNLVNPGDYVIDIGANIGYFTAILQECVGTKGKVFSIEALAPTADLLEKSKQFNYWNNVYIYQTALSNTIGKKFFLINSINPGGSCIISSQEAEEKKQLRNDAVIEVPVTTLDILLNSRNLPQVDFIKIDAEGVEDLILEGAENLINQFHPTICFEFTPERYRSRGVDPLEVLKKFYEQGYRFGIVNKLLDNEDLQHEVAIHNVNPETVIQTIDKLGNTHLDLVMIHINNLKNQGDFHEKIS